MGVGVCWGVGGGEVSGQCAAFLESLEKIGCFQGLSWPIPYQEVRPPGNDRAFKAQQLLLRLEKGCHWGQLRPLPGGLGWVFFLEGVRDYCILRKAS